jgi:hypothetical protein
MLPYDGVAGILPTYGRCERRDPAQRVRLPSIELDGGRPERSSAVTWIERRLPSVIGLRLAIRRSLSWAVRTVGEEMAKWLVSLRCERGPSARGLSLGCTSIGRSADFRLRTLTNSPRGYPNHNRGSGTIISARHVRGRSPLFDKPKRQNLTRLHARGEVRHDRCIADPTRSTWWPRSSQNGQVWAGTHTLPIAPSRERRVAVIRSNHFDGPALACFVAVPLGGTLELSCRSSQLPKTHFGLRVEAVVPKSSSYLMLTAEAEVVMETASLGGMRLPRYV